jgi:hypothetical protein
MVLVRKLLLMDNTLKQDMHVKKYGSTNIIYSQINR